MKTPAEGSAEGRCRGAVQSGGADRRCRSAVQRGGADRRAAGCAEGSAKGVQSGADGVTLVVQSGAEGAEGAEGVERTAEHDRAGDAVVQADVDELRRHLEVAEEQQEDEEVVHGERVLDEVGRQKVESRLGALERVDPEVEGEGGGDQVSKGGQALLVHASDRARVAQGRFELVAVDLREQRVHQVAGETCWCR